MHAQKRNADAFENGHGEMRASASHWRSWRWALTVAGRLLVARHGFDLLYVLLESLAFWYEASESSAASQCQSGLLTSYVSLVWESSRVAPTRVVG